MPYQINTVAAVQRQTGLKIGIVGASGIGKTPLALTTPNPERTLIVDVDRGLKSLGSAAISFDWVIIDDTSAVADLWLSEARVLFPGDKWPQFEHVARKTIETIIGFRNLSQHVVFIAKASQDQTGQWVPHFPGRKLEKEWPYLLDSIGYMRAVVDDNGTPRRFIQFQPDGEYQAKDRNGRLTYEECSLTKIAEKIFPSEQQQPQGELTHEL